jgi:hypothetical protein
MALRNVFTFILLFTCNALFCQDSLKTVIAKKKKIGFIEAMQKDTGNRFYPRKATIRSAILPGWGQAYNKSYWKIPVVYAALGISAGVFFHNIKQYKAAKRAYIYAIDSDPLNDSLIPEPYFSVKSQPDVIRTFRNQVRQNVDYSVLVFIAFWGLNVAEATVDAHLKSFDVGDNLSLDIKPLIDPFAKTAGIGLTLNFKNRSRPAN